MRSAIRAVELNGNSVESVNVDFFSSADPTGAAVSFAVTAEGTQATTSSTWVAGSWATAYGTVLNGVSSVSDPGWSTARTPTLGLNGSIAIASVGRWWLSIKTTVGGETPIETAAVLIVV